jgi:hypothetical protein
MSCWSMFHIPLDSKPSTSLTGQCRPPPRPGIMTSAHSDFPARVGELDQLPLLCEGRAPDLDLYYPRMAT